MNSKLRIAFIYHKENPFMTGNHFDNTYYNFFIKAFKRNPKLTAINFPTGDKFDCTELKDDFDAVLLWENTPFGMPKKIIGINALKIPILCRTGDPSWAKESRKLHEEWNINHYFDFFPESFIRQIYPSDFKYRTIFYGLEAQLYKNLTPFNQRIKDRILVTGAIGKTKLASKLANSLKTNYQGKRNLFSKWSALQCYTLRTKCTTLPYVDYTTTLAHEYINDKYPLLLQKYASSIAATTYHANVKYWEIPAAGCLTFMEVTEKNNAKRTGFIDDETCVYINESNYVEKFSEFLETSDDPKWEKIASNGRKFALDNFNNDVAVTSLIQLIRDIIKEKELE